MALLQWDLPEVLMELSFVCLLFLFHALGRNICSLLHRVNTTHGPKTGYGNVETVRQYTIIINNIPIIVIVLTPWKSQDEIVWQTPLGNLIPQRWLFHLPKKP